MSHKELIKRLFSLQEERVKVYKTFDRVPLDLPGKNWEEEGTRLAAGGFREYLQTAPNYDFPSYRQMVHDVTKKFNNISNDVIDIETKLRESGQNSIGDLIRKIQLKEKEKLELTAKLQIAEQNAASDPSDEDKVEESAALKTSLQKLTDLIIELLDELKYEAEDILLENT